MDWNLNETERKKKREKTKEWKNCCHKWEKCCLEQQLWNCCDKQWKFVLIAIESTMKNIYSTWNFTYVFYHDSNWNQFTWTLPLLNCYCYIILLLYVHLFAIHSYYPHAYHIYLYLKHNIYYKPKTVFIVATHTLTVKSWKFSSFFITINFSCAQNTNIRLVMLIYRKTE